MSPKFAACFIKAFEKHVVNYFNTLAGNKGASQNVIFCYIERTLAQISVCRREKFDRN